MVHQPASFQTVRPKPASPLPVSVGIISQRHFNLGFGWVPPARINRGSSHDLPRGKRHRVFRRGRCNRLIWKGKRKATSLSLPNLLHRIYLFLSSFSISSSVFRFPQSLRVLTILYEISAFQIRRFVDFFFSAFLRFVRLFRSIYRSS